MYFVVLAILSRFFKKMPRPPRRRAFVTVIVLFLINLLNYMDRFTVAGEFQNVLVISCFVPNCSLFSVLSLSYKASCRFLSCLSVASFQVGL